MWYDWLKSTQVSRQARCSSRQLVNSGGTTGIDVRSGLRIAQQCDRVAGRVDHVLETLLTHSLSFESLDSTAPATRAARLRPALRASPTSPAGAHADTCSSCAKPQSVPAITFSRPTSFANRTIRSATSRGCSTRRRVMRHDARDQIFPAGSFTFSHTRHSCSCRTLAASIEYAPARTFSISGRIASSGASATCGTCQLPKQTW